jgi:hypothetical protein
MAKGGTKIVRRNSDSGRFVTKEYVKSHPKTTETEHRPARKPSSSPKKNGR